MSFLGADALREDSKGFSFEENSDIRLAAVSVTKFLIGQGQATTLVALCSTAKGGLNPYLAVSRFLLVKATNIIQSSETQPQMGCLGG